MIHEHLIIDSDTHFVIDPITRKITNLSPKPTLIQYDHNSERYTFEMPRMGADGHDMSTVSKVEIHFHNVSADKHSKKIGVYETTVTVDDNDNVVCSWLISNKATQLVGTLVFALRYICLDAEGEPEYSWGTLPYEGINVTESVFSGG